MYPHALVGTPFIDDVLPVLVSNYEASGKVGLASADDRRLAEDDSLHLLVLILVDELTSSMSSLSSASFRTWSSVSRRPGGGGLSCCTFVW